MNLKTLNQFLIILVILVIVAAGGFLIYKFYPRSTKVAEPEISYIEEGGGDEEEETEGRGVEQEDEEKEEELFHCAPGERAIDDRCFRQLNDYCTVLHEGEKDHSKAVDIVIIGADYLPTVFFLQECYYFDKLDKYLLDAQIAVDEFLSFEVYNRHKDIFNFYLEDSTITTCIGASEVGRCQLWDKVGENCGIDYDAVVILVNHCYDEIIPLSLKHEDIPPTFTVTRQGVAAVPYIEVFQSVGIFIHEISHLVGLADEYAFTVYGPNLFKSLESCRKPLCEEIGAVEYYYEYEEDVYCPYLYRDPKSGQECCGEVKYTDTPGGTCCYPLAFYYSEEIEESGYYTTNENSMMKNEQINKFSSASKNALEKILTEIETIGFDRWKYNWLFNDTE